MGEVTVNVNNDCVARRIKIFHFFKWYMIFDNIKEFFRGIKVIYQRARYGLSYRDVWNLDAYVAEVLANGCSELATGCSYPDGTTYEDWCKDLRNFVNIARNYVDEPWHISKIKNGGSYKDAYEKDRENFDEFIRFLQEHYRSLWD